MRSFTFLSIRFTILSLSILFASGTLLWLIAKDLGISGRLDVVYDFSHDSPFIKRLWPPGRVLPIEFQNGAAVQRMIIDPVFVNVRLPRLYRDATVEVIFQKPEEQELKIGIRVRPDGWYWEIRPLQIEPAEKPGFFRGRVTFENLRKFDVTDDGEIYFLLNAPNLLESGRSILFTEFRVIAIKEPLRWWDTLPRGFGFIKRLL